MHAISNQAIQTLLEQHIADANVQVQGDGYKYQATIISPAFADKNTVQRHKLVYAALNEAIAGGSLHALTIHAYTPEEYATIGNAEFKTV